MGIGDVLCTFILPFYLLTGLSTCYPFDGFDFSLQSRITRRHKKNSFDQWVPEVILYDDVCVKDRVVCEVKRPG